MHTFDDLQEIIQALRQKAKEQNVPIMQGFPSNHRMVEWQGEWTEYLEVANLVKISLLYLQAEPFDLEQENTLMIAENNSRILLLDDEDAERLWLSQRLREQTEGWSKYDQQVGHILCLWFKEGVGHRLELNTVWYLEYCEAVNRALKEVDDVKNENRRIHTEEQAMLSLQRAKEFARHERFADASNNEKRQYMAEQLFPDLVDDEYSLKQVVNLAQLVYWWEVEPEERATKEQKARDLREQGESIKNIAALLGMSEAKVKIAVEPIDID